MQVASESGHAATLPWQVLVYFGVVETLLFLIHRGVFPQFKIARAALALVLVLIAPITVLGVRGWSADFLPIALGLQAVWLAPRVITACAMWIFRE